MKTTSFILGIAIALTVSQSARASVVKPITNEVIEKLLNKSAQRGGREILDHGASQAAIETMERMTQRHGAKALQVVKDGGIELVHAVPQYGDEIFDIAVKATPAGRQVLAANLPALAPLAKRAGVEAVELEARCPGLANRTFFMFGDEGGRLLAKNAPAEDIPRLLRYAEKADHPTTRQLLLKQYQKEGKSIFERIPAKLILASGLSASMIYGTHRGTEPFVATGDAIRRNEELAGNMINQLVTWSSIGGTIILLVIILLFWRFKLMPCLNKKNLQSVSETNAQTQNSSDKDQSDESTSP